MVNAQRPDEDDFLSTEPDVEGHLVGLPGLPGVTADDEDDVEGHSRLHGKPIDR